MLERPQFNNPVTKSIQAWQQLIQHYQGHYHCSINSYLTWFISISIFGYNFPIWRLIFQEGGLLLTLLLAVEVWIAYFMALHLLSWERYSTLISSFVMCLGNVIGLYHIHITTNLNDTLSLQTILLQMLPKPGFWLYIFLLSIWPAIGVGYLLTLDSQPWLAQCKQKLHYLGIAIIIFMATGSLLYAIFKPVIINSPILSKLLY